jgi:VWFA-related protein
MAFTKLTCALFVSLLPAALPVGAQQSLPAIAPPAPSSSSQRIRLDVVVNTKTGQPVTSLRQQDFTILDNKSPRPITSFKVASAKKEPVTVIVLVDAVNIPIELVSDMRNQTEKFLKANEGKLAHPTTIAVLTDDGIQLNNSFSMDGNALSDALEHHLIGLRQITRSSQWSGIDRLTICLKALHQITAVASALPGRKIILWISPGWPLLSGPDVDLDSKQRQQIFSEVVFFSSQLRQGDITLYNVNPVGVSESLFNANYYQTFLKGVAKTDDAQFASLSIQVLSVQTGGLTFESDNDVARMIERCLADADFWYEVSFDPSPADKPNEYHHIEVRLDQPGLIARTRDGYYANPLAADSAR